MKDNTIRKTSVETGKAAPVSARYANAAKTNEVKSVVAGGAAWNTQLVQYKTTHGPMDVRLWRSVK